MRSGILALIERNSSKLKELSALSAFSERDYQKIHDLVSEILKEEQLFGHVAIWDSDGSPWLPEFQESPPNIKILTVPEEWNRWQPDLAAAERSEFQRRNLSEAASLYKRILDGAKDNQVKAWLWSRIARCEIKQGNFVNGLNVYRSIISHYSGLFTESGRPLELVSRLEMLDVFRSDKDHKSFFRDSLDTYRMLEHNIWFLGGEQIKTYTTILQNVIDEVIEDSSNNILEDYIKSISDIQDAIAPKGEPLLMADAVGQNSLSFTRDMQVNVRENSPLVQKNAIEFEGDDHLQQVERGRETSNAHDVCRWRRDDQYWLVKNFLPVEKKD